MTQVWRPTPAFKIEISGETYINNKALSAVIMRPENNISSLVLTISDYKSTQFVDVFDAFDSIDYSLSDDGGSTWTKVFSGTVGTTAPRRGFPKGEFLDVSAWGKGIAAWRTHCNESYGIESILK